MNKKKKATALTVRRVLNILLLRFSLIYYSQSHLATSYSLDICVILERPWGYICDFEFRSAILRLLWRFLIGECYASKSGDE